MSDTTVSAAALYISTANPNTAGYRSNACVPGPGVEHSMSPPDSMVNNTNEDIYAGDSEEVSKQQRLSSENVIIVVFPLHQNDCQKIQTQSNSSTTLNNEYVV